MPSARVLRCDAKRYRVIWLVIANTSTSAQSTAINELASDFAVQQPYVFRRVYVDRLSAPRTTGYPRECRLRLRTLSSGYRPRTFRCRWRCLRGTRVQKPDAIELAEDRERRLTTEPARALLEAASRSTVAGSRLPPGLGLQPRLFRIRKESRRARYWPAPPASRSSEVPGSETGRPSSAPGPQAACSVARSEVRPAPWAPPASSMATSRPA